MTICERCKKPIRQTEDWQGKAVACESEPISGYARRGRLVEIYPVHECQGDLDEGSDGDPDRAA